MSGPVDRTPEEAARDWPEEGRIAALITAGEEGVPFAALDLMEELADRWRPSLLVSLGPEGRLPDAGGEEAERPGLGAVVRGEATLKEAARARPDRSFAFLPAGEEADPDELLRSRALERLAEGVRDAGGILILHVPDSVDAPPPDWLDGRLLAGGATADGLSPDWGELADLGRLAGTEGAAGSGGETRSGRWRRHRKDGDVPVARLAAAVIGIVVIVGGWWLLARESIDLFEGASSPPAADTTAAVSPDDSVPATAAAAPSDTSPETEATQTTDTSTAADADTAAETGRTAGDGAATEPPELRYSVLVASYQREDDAARRVERIRESVTVPVFASPTPVGDRVYHRVFAGAHPDTGAAAELMRELADRGLKRSVSDWDLRPARWSLLLDRFDTEEAARRARAELGTWSVHAYVLPEPARRDTAYLLYAGAFESPEAAETLLRQLRESGRTAQVMMRRGEPR